MFQLRSNGWFLVLDIASYIALRDILLSSTCSRTPRLMWSCRSLPNEIPRRSRITAIIGLFMPSYCLRLSLFILRGFYQDSSLVLLPHVLGKIDSSRPYLRHVQFVSALPRSDSLLVGALTFLSLNIGPTEIISRHSLRNPARIAENDMLEGTTCVGG